MRSWKTERSPNLCGVFLVMWKQGSRVEGMARDHYLFFVVVANQLSFSLVLLFTVVMCSVGSGLLLDPGRGPLIIIIISNYYYATSVQADMHCPLMVGPSGSWPV